MRICITHSLRKQRKWHNIRTGRRGDFPVGLCFVKKYVILKNMTKKGAKEYAVDTF